MKKDLNDGNFEKKYLMINKFSKIIYIKDQKKFLESDLYIRLDVVIITATITMRLAIGPALCSWHNSIRSIMLSTASDLSNI